MWVCVQEPGFSFQPTKIVVAKRQKWWDYLQKEQSNHPKFLGCTGEENLKLPVLKNESFFPEPSWSFRFELLCITHWKYHQFVKHFLSLAVLFLNEVTANMLYNIFSLSRSKTRKSVIVCKHMSAFISFILLLFLDRSKKNIHVILVFFKNIGYLITMILPFWMKKSAVHILSIQHFL